MTDKDDMRDRTDELFVAVCPIIDAFKAEFIEAGLIEAFSEFATLMACKAYEVGCAHVTAAVEASKIDYEWGGMG